jgi:hypothetical protein
MAIRYEGRVIRPFIGVEDFVNSLLGIQVFVNNRLIPLSNKIYLDRSDFDKLKVEIRLDANWSKVRDVATDAGYGLDEIRFGILATGKTLKVSELLHDVAIGVVAPNERISFDVNDVPKVFLDQIGGFEVTCALYLAVDRPPALLQVHQAGTWLEKTTFTVLPEKGASFFSPQPMNSAEKLQLGIHKDSAFFADCRESMLEAEDVDDVFRFYVDSDLLNRLQTDVNPSSRVAAAMMARMAMTALVAHLASTIRGEDLPQLAEEIDAGVYDSFVIKKFVDGTKRNLKLSSTQELLSGVVERPEWLVSRMEGVARMLGDLNEILENQE